MGTDQIMYCIVALILGMLMYHMLKGVCGCKNVVEGNLADDFIDLVASKSTKAHVYMDPLSAIQYAGVRRMIEIDGKYNPILKKLEE
jgi:hypothetical protein